MADVARRVAVVGAGWAGLAAAVTLADHGIPVTVFEASRQLGGRARRVTLEGMDLDNGQHIVIGAYTETLRLMRLVGAAPERLFLRMPLELRMAQGFHLRAARLPAPFHLLAGLLRASGVGFGERLAAAKFIVHQRRNGYRVAQDEPVAAWLDRHMQALGIRNALWEPLCIAALNTPPWRASARIFLNVLRDTIEGGRSGSDLLLPRVDLSALFPEPAARFLASRGTRVHLAAPVRTLALSTDGVCVNGSDDRYDCVIVACAPQHASALLQSLPALRAIAAAVERFEYEPIYTCYLQYPPEHALPGPMVGFTNRLAQWAFDRGALSGHRGLIACVISGSGPHEDLSSTQLAIALHAELTRDLRSLPQPIWSRVIAEKRATFSCRPGLARPENATPVDRVFLAGDYTASEYPATLEAAMRSGVRAAKLAIAASA